ncbi:MAG: DUF4878 domain-containing protein [Prevotellaceae bacterium]|nr:DUF4878 domain-containing protein [Candidatus Minthosoma caballi]
MKKLVCYILWMMVGMSLLTFTSCHDAITDSSDAPKQAMQGALDALKDGNMDMYFECLDFDSETDSVQMALMLDLLLQHREWQNAQHKAISSIDIVDCEMMGDTVCTVYYQFSYADGVKEVSSQKMVRKDGIWKLRLRN